MNANKVYINSVKQKIVSKFIDILREYFSLLSQSEHINLATNMFIGVNAIYRVFECILLKTKSLERANFYSQKTYYYYLEYMHQIINSNLSNNLNHMDAVLFVYKKTIFDITDDEDNNKMKNLMSINDNKIEIEDDIIRNLLLVVYKTMNILFYWENKHIDFSQRKMIFDNYLEKFLSKLDNQTATNCYLEIIQDKVDMSYFQYDLLLKEILVKIEKKRSKVEKHFDEYFLIKFFAEESVFFEKFEKGDMKEFVDWLYI
jgi:hypothetical protein